MRLLAVINSLNPGGAENLLLGQLNALPPGCQSAVVCLDERGSLAHMAEAAGSTVIETGGAGRLDPRRVGALRRTIAAWRPDLVHIHLPRSGFFGRLACRSYPDLPVVYTEHNIWEMYSRGTRLMNRWTYARNDLVIAVSEAVRRSTLAHVPARVLRRPVVVIPNAVDVCRLERECLERAEARRLLGLPQDGMVIGNIGNLFGRKGHRFLLEAASALQARHPGVHFAVIGRGREYSQLAQLRDSLGLSRRVTFITGVSDAARYIPAFDIFALPSVFEGLPVALLEAMALALPCVASSVGGVPELIQDGQTGILTRPRSADSLASALDDLIRTPEYRRRLGGSAREWVRVRHSFDSYLNRHLQQYSGVAARLVLPGKAVAFSAAGG